MSIDWFDDEARAKLLQSARFEADADIALQLEFFTRERDEATERGNRLLDEGDMAGARGCHLLAAVINETLMALAQARDEHAELATRVDREFASGVVVVREEFPGEDAE